MSFKKKYLKEGVFPYFIAEIGINHNGHMALAKRMIDASKEAHADAVKFQKRNFEALLLPGVEIEETAAAATHGTLPGYRRTLWLTGNATGIELAVPLSSTPEPLGRGGQYDWWIGGQDIVGIRGGQPGAASVHLPTDGTIDILVLPGADPAAARQAGVPLLEEAS